MSQDLAGASTLGELAAIMPSHIPGVHVDDGSNTATEHALPMELFDVLAMVGASQRFRVPFLLKEGFRPR